VSEVSADWITNVMHVPVVHTMLPSSNRVAAIILEQVERHATLARVGGLFDRLRTL